MTSVSGVFVLEKSIPHELLRLLEDYECFLNVISDVISDYYSEKLMYYIASL